MPAYTFRCQKCNQEVEIVHSFHEPHPVKHQGCGGRLVRKFHPPEVVYKGSGFYHTDKRLDTPGDEDLQNSYEPIGQYY